MKPLRVVLAVLALSVPTSAHAALIGLAGGDYDPPAITNPALFDLVACSTQNAGLPLDYSCVFYDFANLGDDEFLDSVQSIDFRILDEFGNYIPFPDLLFTDNDANNPQESGFSELTGDLIASPIFDDGFTFRLAGVTQLEESISPFDCDPDSDDGCELAFFVGPDQYHTASQISQFRAAVVGVNGIANPGATPVPEPATLLLMGPAALALLARRRARRNRLT